MKTRPPFHRRSPSAAGARAFTLIELVAAMAVLTLLLVSVSEMISGAAAVTAGSTRHLDADSQARLVLDRMAVDFSQIVKRQDVDYYLQKNGAGLPGMNDQMVFYSETSGYYPAGVVGPVPKSNAALVGYRINNRQLERLNKALVWNGVTSGTAGATALSGGARAMTFLPQTLALAWPTVIGTGADTDYQVIGESVFRMEICYLVRNAATPATLSDTPYLPVAGATPAASPTPTPYNGLRDVAAVVVTLAVLDDTTRLIVQPADLDAAAAKLDDVSGATLTNTAATLWQAHIDKGELVGGSNGAGLSKIAAGQVRVYERYFYLGNAQ